jgi:shikimate dehydrogenase
LGFEFSPRLAYNLRVSGTAAQPIDASTRYCAVFGYPVRHSASPAMQNAGLAALGLNWRYLACEVQPDHLRAALAGARAMNFIGLNLTVPHKVLAVECMDALDDSARTWGTVNTVRFEGKDAAGAWRPLREFRDAPPETRAHGFNTDADAITRSLREDLGLELAGTKVLLLGAGGAGRTAALKLAADKVSELFLVNRTPSKADAVAAEIRQRFPAVKAHAGFPAEPVDLVMNATSLGLKPGDGSPLDESRFPLRRAGAVYDMIYRPAETPLLRAARAAGCRTANGLGMLLYQGARALEIWTEQPAPIETMRQALELYI